MLRSAVIAVSILLSPFFSLAQNEANMWYFGNNAGIDFNPTVPIPLLDGAMSTFEGCTSIADATTGQLLFYTDGITVWNRNHLVMPNGAGLLGDASSSQSAIAVPQPNAPNLFYIFTVDNEAGANGCRYSLLDMNLAGGLGDVTGIKNQLLIYPSTEKLASACHENGTDYWMITHGYGNNSFHAYQISSTGLNTIPVTSSVGAVHGGSPVNTIGEMEVSPDGSRLALCSWTGALLEVFDFNSATGVVTNPIPLPSNGEEYGCAFSPDGTKVYYTSCCTTPKEVIQFDLNAGSPAAIAASRVVIWSGISDIAAMQTGPDGRIYVASGGQASLDVITNPNGVGAACGYVQNSFNLGGRFSLYGLPTIASCLTRIVLDAELGVFFADVTDNLEVQLYWEAVEKASQGTYEVERSADGAYFYGIGEVPFVGNQPEKAQLNFLDRKPLPENNLYRIKVTDPNGEISLSEVVEVSPGSALGTQIRLSPNPANDQVELSIYVQGGQTAPWQVQVYSVTGKLVLQSQLGSLPPGYNAQNLDLSTLEAGLYSLRLQCGAHKEEVRLLKNK